MGRRRDVVKLEIQANLWSQSFQILQLKTSKLDWVCSTPLWTSQSSMIKLHCNLISSTLVLHLSSQHPNSCQSTMTQCLLASSNSTILALWNSKSSWQAIKAPKRDWKNLFVINYCWCFKVCVHEATKISDDFSKRMPKLFGLSMSFILIEFLCALFT
jgi:hypothetical protein